MKILQSFVIMGFLGLTGCSLTTPVLPMSYVMMGLTEKDSQIIAQDVANYLSKNCPPAQTQFAIAPVKDNQSNLLTALMVDRLRSAGYGITFLNAEEGTDSMPSSAKQLHYTVSPLEQGVFVKVQYDTHAITRFYPRNAEGVLQSTSPFMVRN